MIESVSNVRTLPEAGAYIATVTLDGETLEYVARPDDDAGISAEIIAIIDAGEHIGSITQEPLPAPAPEPAMSYSKARLIDSMTDAEFIVWDAQQSAILSTLSERQVAVWIAASQFDSDHPLFPTIEGAMISAWGASRASALLAAAKV